MSRTSARAFLRLVLLAALLASSMAPMAGSVRSPSLVASPAVSQQQEAASSAEAPSASPMPLLFMQNTGQYPDSVLFEVWGGGRSAWLAQDGLWLSVSAPDQSPAIDAAAQAADRPGAATAKSTQRLDLKLSFVGAAAKPVIEPFGRLDTHVSYYMGNDSQTWRADVPVWTGVCYKGLYPGIDLEISGAGGYWSWQVQAQAGADLGAVQLRVQGAQNLSLQGGSVRLRTELGDLLLPLIEVAGQSGSLLTRPIPEPAIAADSVISPLTSVAGDPTLDGASDLMEGWVIGGSSDEAGMAVAVQGSSVYYTGWTNSSNWPTMWGKAYNGGSDIFVLRCSLSPCAVGYFAFLGGSGDDAANAIAVDGSGNAYITGSTTSTNFPHSTGAFDTSCGPDGTCYNPDPMIGMVSSDAFLVKLDGTGALLYGTYLGGVGVDIGRAIAVNSAGKVFITGSTSSNDFPTSASAFDRKCGITASTCQSWHYPARYATDAFVTKLIPAGNGAADLLYSTFLGGATDDDGWAIALNGSNAYVAGQTQSSGFPTTVGAYQTTCGTDTHCNPFGHGFWGDVFVAELNSSGSSLIYGTFLGGQAWEEARGIALDSAANAYVTGFTTSADFPVTASAYDRKCGTDGQCNWVYPGPSYPVKDVFVTKLNSTGSALLYSTFVGGAADDEANGIVVDSTGNAYVVGETGSTDLPTTVGAYDRSRGGPGADAFVLKLNSTGGSLQYGTYLGGSADDSGNGIALRSTNSVYLTGQTKSSDFPVAGGGGGANGPSQVYLAKVLTPYVLRTNAGGPTYVDSAGFTWQADVPYAAGGWGYTGSSTSASTVYHFLWGDPDITLYQSARSGMSGYNFTVLPGTYRVTLKFAENTVAKSGKRKFMIGVEGLAPQVLDIFAQAGGQRYTTADLVFNTRVTDGVLNIVFTPVIGTVQVSAISVEQVGD